MQMNAGQVSNTTLERLIGKWEARARTVGTVRTDRLRTAGKSRIAPEA